jgi:hypothetical protein
MMVNITRQGQAGQLAKVQADPARITPRMMLGPLLAFVRGGSRQDFVAVAAAATATGVVLAVGIICLHGTRNIALNIALYGRD